MIEKDDWRGIGPLYVKQLAEANLIDNNIFAFFLESYVDNPSLVSFVDIGAIVPEHVRPGHAPVWFKLTPHMYWMVENVHGVRYSHGDSYNWLKHGNAKYKAIFDSGTSLTMIPQPLY